jgi:hypothetical protein
MAVILTIEPGDPIMVANVSGELSFESALRSWKGICDAAAKHSARRVLVNCRGVTGELSTLQRYELGVETVKYIRNHKINPQIAVIGEPPALDGFAVVVARNRGASAAMFRDMRRALEWLER